MNHIKLPYEESRQLPFFLAMEEHLLHTMAPDADDAFWLWQVPPTVIFGRNQICSREVDLDYCRTHGIEVYRRKSGGGCVFANLDNIMMSYVTRSKEPVTDLFARYTAMIVNALRQMGIDADSSSRNDILIAGGKVSGNAYYRTSHGSIIHGTMLFDTDRHQMCRALTPSAQKLASKGVSSVASRVTTLRQHTDMDIHTFKSRLISALCTTSTTLTDADIEAVGELARPYYSDEWRLGLDRRCSHRQPRRVEGAGEFVGSISLNPLTGTIADVKLAGDFFMIDDIDTALLNHLKGAAPKREEMRHALRHVDASKVIAGLTTNQLIDLLI